MENYAPVLKCLMRCVAMPILGLVLCFAWAPGHAQDQGSQDLSAITLEHKPPNLKDVDPGSEIVLRAYLRKTGQTDLKIRCFFTRDGRLAELPLDRSYRNEYDVPTYEFKTPAPIGGATYYFALYRGNGLPLISERYVMMRECLPGIELTDLNPPAEDLDGEKLLLRIRDQARSLERDIARYENARKLTQELKELLGGQ